MESRSVEMVNSRIFEIMCAVGIKTHLFFTHFPHQSRRVLLAQFTNAQTNPVLVRPPSACSALLCSIPSAGAPPPPPAAGPAANSQQPRAL